MSVAYLSSVYMMIIDSVFRFIFVGKTKGTAKVLLVAKYQWELFSIKNVLPNTFVRTQLLYFSLVRHLLKNLISVFIFYMLFYESKASR